MKPWKRLCPWAVNNEDEAINVNLISNKASEEVFSHLIGCEDLAESDIMNWFQYDRAKVPHNVLTEEKNLWKCDGEEVKNESNEECSNAIGDHITHMKAATDFERGLMYLLKQHNTNSIDVMLLKHLIKEVCIQLMKTQKLKKIIDLFKPNDL